MGDANFQRKCLAKMEDVGGRATVLFVSHHMPHALCERTIPLKQGEIIADGPPPRWWDYLLRWHCRPANPALAPGNEVVRLRAVRARTETGESSYAMDIREPIGVEMEYEVLQDGHVLYPYFTVANDESLILFTSVSSDPEWRSRPRPAGRYVSTG